MKSFSTNFPMSVPRCAIDASVQHGLRPRFDLGKADHPDVFTAREGVHAGEGDAQGCHFRVHLDGLDSFVAREPGHEVARRAVLEDYIAFSASNPVINVPQDIGVVA